jgi:hypothetical protein
LLSGTAPNIFLILVQLFFLREHYEKKYIVNNNSIVMSWQYCVCRKIISLRSELLPDKVIKIIEYLDEIPVLEALLKFSDESKIQKTKKTLLL